MFVSALGFVFLATSALLSLPTASDSKSSYELVEGTDELSPLSGMTSDSVLDLKINQSELDESTGRALRLISFSYCHCSSGECVVDVDLYGSPIRSRKAGGSATAFLEEAILMSDTLCEDPSFRGHFLDAKVGQLYYVTGLQICDTGGKKKERTIAGLRAWGRPILETLNLPNTGEVNDNQKKTIKAGEVKSAVLEETTVSWLGNDLVKHAEKKDTCKKWREKVECPAGKVAFGVRVHYDDIPVRITGMSLWCATVKQL